jgi:predicted component of type VI protein secretion system
MAFRLILQSGISPGTEFPLEKAELFIGRDLSNDIVISDSEVSRRHARLALTGNTYSIEDLGSTNGTFLRGQRITAPVALTPGEVITFGENMQLKFDFAVVDPDATVAAFRRPAPGSSQPFGQPSQPVQQPPSATPPAPQATPSYQPPQSAIPQSGAPQPPVSQPASTPPVPAQPAYAPVASVAPIQAPPPQKKKRSGWLVAILVVIGILVVFCLIPWLIIEITNSYCALFPGIFNSIQPGVCP